jgi:large subunit ribosomal protein L5
MAKTKSKTTKTATTKSATKKSATKKSATKASGKSAGKPGADTKAGNGFVPRLLQRYRDEVVPKLMKEFGIENPMGVPRISKVSLNMGLGEAIENIKILDDAVDEVSMLAGQRPSITRAHKSIANFKVREGMPIGCRVTLRDQRMWAFLDRLITIALPRVRDFRGVPRKSFDGRGNYTLGIEDHLIFPEVDYNKVERSKGLNVTIVTTAGNDERALYLLSELGMPFRR